MIECDPLLPGLAPGFFMGVSALNKNITEGKTMQSQKKLNPLRERAKTYKFILPASSDDDQDLILVDKLFDNRNLSMHGKLVGLFLTGCIHNQEIWPSLNMIARRCRIGKLEAIKAIRELKSQGFLEELRYRLDGKVIKNA